MLRHLGILALVVGFTGLAQAVPPDALLPDDAEMVLAVNVRSLSSSPFFRTYLHDLAKDFLSRGEPIARVWQALAIDPLADVTTLVVAGRASFSVERYLIVLRGRFEPEKVRAAANSWIGKNPTALTIHKEEGRLVYEFKAGLSSLFVCLLDSDTLILARTRGDVDEAIAKKQGKRKPALNQALTKLLSQTNGQGTVWLAALTSPGLKKELATSPEMEKLVAGIGNIQGSITMGDDCAMQVVIGTADAKTAGELRQFAEAVKAILSLAAMDHKTHAPLLSTLVAGLQATNGPDGVTLGGKVTKEQIEKAMKAKP